MRLVTPKLLEVGDVLGEPSDSGRKSGNGNWTLPCHGLFNVKLNFPLKGRTLMGLVGGRVSFV